jgi:uncharacterized protein (TIGR02996 family)
MSCRLRYDIGIQAADQIVAYEAGSIAMQSLGGRTFLYWGGTRKGHHSLYTFTVKLPGQVWDAWVLLKVVDIVAENGDSGIVRNSCRKLAEKMRLGLGIVPHGCGPPGETAFTEAIDANPANLDRWAVYADWLEETKSTAAARRAVVIRGWLGKARVKVKQGVPLAARGA